jgi:hypothetical protein
MQEQTLSCSCPFVYKGDFFPEMQNGMFFQKQKAPVNPEYLNNTGTSKMNKTWIALSLSAGLFTLAGCQPQQAAQAPAQAEQARLQLLPQPAAAFTAPICAKKISAATSP